MAGSDSDEEIIAVKHPFQIEVLGGPLGAYDVDPKDGGTFVRVDMPGVPDYIGVRLFMKSEIWTVNFQGKEFVSKYYPYEKSGRIYAGGVSLNRNPSLADVNYSIKDGVLTMFFPRAKCSLLFLPRKDNPSKVSAKSKISSSDPVKSSEEAAKSDMDKGSSCNLAKSSEKTAKSEMGEGSSSNQETSSEKTAKSEMGEDSSSNQEKSSEEVAKCVPDENSSSNPGKSSETAKSEMDDGSSKEQQSNQSEPITEVTKVIIMKDQGNITVEEWLVGCLNLLNPFVHESPTCCPGETAYSEQSAAKSESGERTGERSSESGDDYHFPFIHEPELTIGTVTDFAQHQLPCDCGKCNEHGFYIKTCYTIDDFPDINRFKLQGPDGVCEKILGQDKEGLLIYVRCDMPGLTKDLFTLRAGERIIVAFGMPGRGDYYKQGGRTYWCIVQNHCPCCTFRDVDYEFRFGVFRMRCRITRTITPPPADH